MGFAPLYPSYDDIGSQTHLRSLAAHLARALRSFLAPKERGRREGRAPTGTRGLPREKHTRKRPHSSIQVSPNARPSLRDGWTAYAVLSREPNFPSGLPRPANWMMQSARLGSLAPPRKLDRSNDGQDHTVLPYAAHPASPGGFAGLQRRSSARSLGLTGTTRPARASRAQRCRVHRNPARVSNDSRTAPLRGPGCVDLCRNSEFR